jgi:hypothetical protein
MRALVLMPGRDCPSGSAADAQPLNHAAATTNAGTARQTCDVVHGLRLGNHITIQP